MTYFTSLRGRSPRHCYQKLSSLARSAASYLTHVSEEGLMEDEMGGREGGNNIAICPSRSLPVYHSEKLPEALPASRDKYLTCSALA